MKTIIKWSKHLGMLVITILLAAFGITGAEAMFASAPAGATATSQPASAYGDADLGGDGAVGEGFQTLGEALEISPNLVTRAIHDEVIKIAPYDYTIRSLMSKNFKQRKKTKDHKVAVYSAASKPIQLKLATPISSADAEQVTLNFGLGNKNVSVNQVITFPHVAGYLPDGLTPSGEPLQVYVLSKATTGAPVVKPLNGIVLVGGGFTLPDIGLNELALRGLRVGSETQIRTEPTNILPTDKEYYIQKNIIEFGASGWFNNATKEVKWTDRDRMEMAFEEKMRTSMPTFWLGTAGATSVATKYNDDKEELAYFSQGVWTQAGKEFNFTSTDITAEDLVDFATYIFTGNRSSNVKYFAMGSELSAALQKVIISSNTKFFGEVYRDKTLDLSFTALTFFGGKKILFADDPSLDDIGMSNCGFVLDQKYGFEYHYGMKTIAIDGIRTQTADVTGQAIVEENSFILTNNDAHCRVVFTPGLTDYDDYIDELETELDKVSDTPTVKVTGGTAGTDADKLTAVKDYVETVIVSPYVSVVYAGSAGKYIVYVGKGTNDVYVQKEITVTFEAP